ncbi:MAG TPA: hypothetical protein VJ276_14135 [Thermoanaerobaculia bacterium]|nr:hypothetical protein [Thermoanaerobaculia bacterium]
MTRRTMVTALAICLLLPLVAHAQICKPANTVHADVVALDQAFYNNRLGTFQSGGMIFALRRDVVANNGAAELQAGHVMLRTSKRPRPMVLRMNVGDCLEVAFQNLLADVPQVYSQFPPANPWTGATTMTAAKPNDPTNPVNKYGTTSNGNNSVIQVPTRWAGVHVMGLNVIGAKDGNGVAIDGISGDGSFAGANDITADLTNPKRASGLVAPGQRITYILFAPAQSEGSYLLYSQAANSGYQPNFGGQLMQGLFGSVTVQPKGAEYYRSQVTRAELWAATYRSAGQKLTPTLRKVKIHGQDAKVWQWWRAGSVRDVVILNMDGDPAADGGLFTTAGQPLIDYQAKDGSGTPILRMTSGSSPRQLVYTDLTAIITGPNAGRLIDSPYAEPNPTPNGHEPWREFAIHYHDDFLTTQAFPQQSSGTLAQTLDDGNDLFAINYGIGGISAEILANRLGYGPMAKCATCAFEEFFLSSWAVGDPAMVVDNPANVTLATGAKASKALYPDDPSNVYHSYVGDHVIFQILHAGTNITHVHHMHAQQWLHSPRNPNGAYRDSQMISPGASFSLNHVYNGSGNINKTIGDSIFHCHFYPHFAEGMWSMWRVHDMFETGTKLNASGASVTGWNRSLPDGEIPAGVATPALVPLPTIAMPLIPARTRLIPVNVADAGVKNPVGYMVESHPDDKELNPGYPFFIPGVAGQRAPHPPLDFAWEENADGTPKTDGSGNKILLDGGLPRHLSIFDPAPLNIQTPQNFSKTNSALTTVRLPEEGTTLEQVAMKFHEHRDAGRPSYPSFTPSGAPARFVVNGMKRAHGAPYANPNRDLHGDVQCNEEDVPPPILDPKDKHQPCLVRYKAAAIQLDAVLNKEGWHFPQTRLLTLWGDVKPTIENSRMPEPFFFRANSEQIIEYWHTNLVPEYYELDDFQVRTPTDVIGQHIHLVKFDVTSSDGAGNGYNYEDGTLGPGAVVHIINASNQCPDGKDSCNDCKAGLFDGFTISGGVAMPSTSKRCLTPKAIPYFGNGPYDEWLGAQTTIQRWSADPVLGLADRTKQVTSYGPDKTRQIDRTLRTVFTHDHFGPSTHQQVGLYAGLLIEPKNSYWIDGQQGVHYGSNQGRPVGADGRPPGDGGPTGWQANIVDRDNMPNSYREFALEFADRQLAYNSTSIAKPVLAGGSTAAATYTGWSDPSHAIQAPSGSTPPKPSLVTNGFLTGSYSVNYRQEPLAFRIFPGVSSAPPNATDLSYGFASIARGSAQLNVQPAANSRISVVNDFRYPAPYTGAQPTDPYTPLLRAYDGDHIQVRTLVGAHQSPHFFNFHGVNWLFEPQEEDSGYRSAQGMGISEHYEMIFSLPKGSGATSDYLYETTSDTVGRQHGNWGLLRSYNSDQGDLVRLPNNKTGSDAPPAGCPASAAKRSYAVKAMTIQNATGQPAIFYNSRGQAGLGGGQKLGDPNGILYVDAADLDGSGKLKSTLKVEPLVLRARAGECIEVTLTNNLPNTAVGPTQGAAFPMTNAWFIDSTASQIQDWLIELTGNFGGTKGFYDDAFRAAFKAGNTLGYELPLSSNVTSITFNGGTTSTIVNGTQTFTVSKASNTRLTVMSKQTFTMSTSTQVGLHVSLLPHDIRDSDGMNIGQNPVQSIAPGASRTYRWYAGRYERDKNGSWMGLPVEYGSVNLNPSDPLLQHPKGLIGALIIEPEGATWTTDANSKLSARVNYKRSGESRTFREFVAVIQDDASVQMTGNSPTSTTFTAANAQWTRAFNYRMEPLQYRYIDKNGFLRNNPALAPNGIVRSMSNQLTLSDPETPVFAAAAGEAVRIRMLHPAGIDEQVLNLHGHSWEEEPYVPGTVSRVIGHNPQSQRNGSRDSFGPNVSWDLVIGEYKSGAVVDGAGGPAKTKGDYMFRTFIQTDFLNGLWGLLRVGDPGKDIVTVNYFPKPGSDARFPAGIQGTVTANTSNGRMADKVEIFSGTSATGTPISPSPTVDPVTGFWTSTASLTPPVFVRSVCTSCSPSTPWGSTVIRAYIPTSGIVSGTTAVAAAAEDETADDDQGLVSKFKPNPAQLTAPPAPEPPQAPPQAPPAPAPTSTPNPTP